MGLCKCPKRKVTNLFCFECKVNVCESCMVESHESCIIQTYLAWLSDSDFLPVCKLCDKPNSFSPCIRFKCLCIFHIECVNRKFSKLPKNTAPAGFKCFECNEKIFPSLNASGPLAQQVKEKLKEYAWARTGLGLPLLKNVPTGVVSENSSVVGESTLINSNFGATSKDSNSNSGVKQRKQVRLNEDQNTVHTHSAIATEINMPDEAEKSAGHDQQEKLLNSIDNSNHDLDNEYPSGKLFKSPSFHPPKSSSRTPDVDFKAFKYRRKSITQRIKRLLQNHYASQKYYEPIMGQSEPILVLLVIIVALVFIWMSTSAVRHHRNDYDPVFDPYRNPNIHTSEEQVKLQ